MADKVLTDEKFEAQVAPPPEDVSPETTTSSGSPIIDRWHAIGSAKPGHIPSPDPRVSSLIPLWRESSRPSMVRASSTLRWPATKQNCENTPYVR